MRTGAKLLWICCLGLLSAANPGLHAAPRIWTNLHGKEIEADLLQVDGDKVRLKLTSGAIYELPVASLSEVDQKFLGEEKERLKNAPQPVPEAAAQPGAKPVDSSKRRAKWTEDWDDAKAEARATRLPVFLLMTGSDWCPPCMQLEATIFEDKAFERFADKNFVLMKADFPNGSQKDSIKKQNAGIKESYPIEGFPTVFLLSSDLKEIAHFVGFGGESPEEYVAKLEATLKGKR